MMSLLKRKRSSPPRSLRKVMDEYELPSFPGAILRSLELIRCEDATTEMITEAIRLDPGLSVGVLKLVNSAGFGRRHTVGDLASAVALIGRVALEPLLISMGLRDVLPQGDGPGFEWHRFWLTAARRATTARALSEILSPAECSQSFTAGLLQDMAIPMLVQRMPDEYGALLEQWNAGGPPLHESEQEAFGWDHAQVAELFCERWQIPDWLRSAIAEHHSISAPECDSPSSIMLAGLIRESEEHDGVQELIDTAHGVYGIDREALKTLLEESFEAAEEISTLLG